MDLIINNFAFGGNRFEAGVIFTAEPRSRSLPLLHRIAIVGHLTYLPLRMFHYMRKLVWTIVLS